MTPEQRGWLAGLLEGEGTFVTQRRRKHGKTYSYPAFEITMTDRDVIERVSALLGNRAVQLCHSPSRKNAGYKPMYRVRVVGALAEGMLLDLYDLFGTRRQQRIDEMLKRKAEDSNPTHVLGDRTG
jgi:hypothetical protein